MSSVGEDAEEADATENVKEKEKEKEKDDKKDKKDKKDKEKKDKDKDGEKDKEKEEKKKEKASLIEKLRVGKDQASKYPSVRPSCPSRFISFASHRKPVDSNAY